MNLKKYKKTKGFTLVELIVVITILAILGSIAFLSFQDFSKDARDSKRISDISNFKKGLELYKTATGDYPLPDSNIVISGNSEDLVYQGFIGDSNSKNVKLSETIKDPKTLANYGYAITSDRKYFQVSYELESGNLASIFQKSFAENEVLKIEGNYTGVFVTAPVSKKLIAMPSLFSAETSDNDLDLTSNSLNFKVSDGDISGKSFVPSEITGTTSSEILANIKTKYNSSNFQNEPEIAKVLEIDTTDSSLLNSTISYLKGTGKGKILELKDSVYKWSDGSFNESCKGILNDFYYNNEGSGIYWIKPDSNPEFKVYCDMETDGGGWTMVVNIASDSALHGLNTKVGNETITPNSTEVLKLSDSTINTIGGENTTIYRFSCGTSKYYYRITDGIWISNGDTSYNNGRIEVSYSYLGNYILSGHAIGSKYGLASYLDNLGNGLNSGIHQDYVENTSGEGDGCYFSDGSWGQSGNLYIK